MKINHTAMYVQDLEKAKAFYEKYFDAKSNERYHNPKTGLQTYFLSFGGESRLEIMTRPDVVERSICKTADAQAVEYLGYTHLAFSTGSKEAVDKLTNQLRNDGYVVCGEPRTTGDGYYESCVLDVEGNRIEIVA